MTQKDTYTPVFIAALFAIAKTWKQPKCPSTEEWIRKMKMWYIYTMEYYSAIKKDDIMPFYPIFYNNIFKRYLSIPDTSNLYFLSYI
uniref:Uncharacterized protein n=1 Tax=Sus scrofa TaxID=9823 RepID=A0A8D1TNE3_PIG